jgi:hypothetical protein
MIPIFIGVAWLNLVTMVIAACRVAAHADAIELEIIVHGVEERVLRGRAALGPLRKAVAAGAFVVGSHVDRARGSALDDLSLDACASQRTVG